jgi:hypothetical protein
MTITIDDFTRAYLACALELAEFDEDSPQALKEASTYDLPDVTLKAAQWDCDEFRAKARDAGKGDYVEGDVERGIGPDLRKDWYTEEQAAYDLWLTRNGHGAGFWDRGLGEAGEVLTKLAHEMGACDLYLGDDGLVYLS